MRARWWIGAVLIATPTLALAQPGPDQAACISAYEQAQELRMAKQLVDAREALLICAASSCPQVARVDCTEWLADVERATPSVVPQLRDENDELVTAAKLYVDDALRLGSLDGSSIPIDPGPHRFRFETPDGETVEKELVVVEGQKRQMIVLRTAPEPAPPVAPEPPVDATYGTPHVATWVLLGIAGAGLGVFAGLGGYSLSLEDCQPTCTDEEVDDIEAMRIGADVGIGVGAVAALSAIIVGIVSSATPDEKVGFAPRVSPGAAGLDAWVRF